MFTKLRSLLAFSEEDNNNKDTSCTAASTTTATAKMTLPPSTTTSSIKVTDEKPCFSLTGSSVDIFVNPGRPTQDHGSSRVKLKNIVDYKWEVKKYHGRLIAVHRDGQVIAYSIKLKTGGMVRVVWNGERALIKGMSNEVLDLQFAHISSKIILACVDDTSLHVYGVEIGSGKLETSLLLKVDNPVEDVPICSHRVNWCPFVPSSAAPPPTSTSANSTTGKTNVTTTTEEANEEEEDYANHLLVWSQGDTFQALNVHLVVEAHGAGTYDYSDLSEGIVQHQESKATITVATFSPDGTTLSVGFEDGNVYFYQMYLYSKESAPRRLYNWKPHGNKPVTALAFLDDHTVGAGNETGSFWKHALTATDNNTEIRLWRCDDWSCVQRICFKPLAFDSPALDFKLDIDASSSYLVLSEQNNRVMYTLQIGKHEEGEEDGEDTSNNAEKKNKNAGKVTSTVAFRSVGEFPLSSSILSFNIAGATKGKYNCGRLEDTDMDEYDEDSEEAADDPMFGVMIQMFLVQPKSVQECNVFFQTENPAQPESAPASLDSLLNDDMDLGTPETLVTKSGSASRQKSSAQINLMAPESFQAPATPTTSTTTTTSDKDISSSVLSAIRMIAESASPSGTVTAVAPEKINEMMLTYATLEEQNKSLRKSLEMRLSSSAVDPPSQSTSLNPMASSTVNDILPSGNSSPSREVQEILSLKDEMFENHLQGSDMDTEDSSGGGNGTEEDEDAEEVLEDEEEEQLNLTMNLTGVTKAMEGIDAIKLYVDDDEEENNNDENNVKSNIGGKKGMEWPKVPNILPDMSKIVVPENVASNLAAANQSNQKQNSMLSCNNGGENNFALNNLSNASTTSTATATPVLVTSFAVESKLDRILDMLSRNGDQISALERRFNQFEQQQSQKALLSTSNSSNKSPVNNNNTFIANEKKLNQTLEAHLMRCEHLVKYELDEVHKKQTKQMNAMRDQVVQTLGQMVRPQFTEAVARTVMVELQPNLMKMVARDLEGVKGMIQYEVQNKLSISDKLLQENVTYMLKQAVQSTFQEQISKLIIPAYERASKEMFKQTNEMFQKGVNNYSKQVHSYMTQFQPVHDQNEKLMSSMKALPEQFKSTNEKVINSFSAQIIHEVNKDFKTLQLNVLKLIKETVRQEVSKGFEAQAANLEDSVLSAVRSQVQTPSVFDIQDQIRSLISQGQVNKAFHQALISNDLSLVEFTLDKADIKDVFNPCHLEQTVLLSLIQQLSADMTAYTDNKHQYLSEAITSLNMSDTVIREHAPKILKQLKVNLHKYTEDNPKGQFGSRIRMLLMMIQGFSVHFS